MEGNSNQNGRKQQFLKLIEKWKEIVISKLLFPSTLLFLEKTKIKWNGMEGNSNAGFYSEILAYFVKLFIFEMEKR